jgi:hypothetical protein
VRVKVLAAADYLAVAPAVVRPRTDVDIPILKTTLLTEPADSEMLDALGTEFGLDSPIARLRTAIGVVTAAS